MSYDIVEMNADDTVQEARLAASAPSFANIVAPMKGDVEHSIKTWLSRPYRLATFNYTVMNTAGAELYVLSLFNSIATTTYYNQKLKGFYGFRATTHFRLQVNGNRFQAGRLLVHYTPSPVNSWRHVQLNASLASKTQLPRVDLDINTDSEVTLTVPYISDAPFYAFDGTSYAGHIGVSVYSPLLSPGAESEVQCTVLVHFTDVELFWPSAVTPQSGMTGGRIKSMNQNTEQFGDHKPVSSALTRVAKTLDILKEVPLISQYVAPLSWAARISAKLASSMGYAKPVSHKRDAVAIQYLANMATGTGFDYSQPMGLFEDNALQVCEGLGGSDLDHLALKYPLSIPTYFDTATWTTSNASDSTLYTKTAKPRAYDATTSSLTQLSQTTPLSFFSRFFSYYRGSINITMKFVKTEFHTGRLRFSYTPGGPFTPSDQSYMYSAIIDLKTSNEVSFNVPYMGADAYLSVKSGGGPTWGITVINELRAPDNVSASVPIIFEVSAGSDFEFAVPCFGTDMNFSWYSTVGAITGTVSETRNIIMSDVTGQAGDPSLVSLQGNYEDNPVGNAPRFEPSLDPSMMAIGERVTSVKQLVQRATPRAMINNTSARFTLNLDPPGAAMGGSTGGSYFGTQNHYDLMRDCYGFSRGSTRVKMVQHNPSSPFRVAFTNAQLNSNVPSSRVVDPLWVDNSVDHRAQLGAMVECPQGQSAVEVCVPNYSLNPARRPLVDVLNRLLTAEALFDARVLVVLPQAGTSFQGPLYASAGDDFQAGLWVTSPCIFSGAAGVNVDPSNWAYPRL